MRISLAGAAVVVAMSGSLLAGVAQATNGYFQHGYGTRTKALAGAGVADAHDSLTLALNPAGLVDVGTRLELGFSLFTPRRAFEADGGGPAAFPVDGRVESDNELFVIPHFGISHAIDSDNAIGFAIYGNGGMNTEFPAVERQCPNPQTGDLGPGAGIFCAGAAGVDLIQLFFAPGYAHRVNDWLSVGISPILSFQRFEATGIQSFAGFSGDPARLSDQGKDYAFGAGVRLGAQAQVSERLGFGISFVTSIYMDRFEKFSGLFAEQGDFDVPPALTVGLKWRASAQLTLLADYQRIWYEDVASVSNPFASPGPLGADDGRGFGWRNVNVARFGAEWRPDEAWTLRAGYAYNNQPVPDSEVLFNVLAPGVVQHHVTGGFSRRIFGGRAEINMAAMFAPEAAVTGPNPINPAQSIRLEMHQYEITLGVTLRF